MKKILSFVSALSLTTLGASSLISCDETLSQKLGNNFNNKHFKNYNWSNINLDLNPKGKIPSKIMDFIIQTNWSAQSEKNGYGELFLKTSSEFNDVLMHNLESWFYRTNTQYFYSNDGSIYEMSALNDIYVTLNHTKDNLDSVKNYFLNWCHWYKTPMYNHHNDQYKLNFFYFLNTYQQVSDNIKIYKINNKSYFIYHFDIVCLDAFFNIHNNISINNIQNRGIEKIYFIVSF